VVARNRAARCVAQADLADLGMCLMTPPSTGLKHLDVLLTMPLELSVDGSMDSLAP